MVSTANLSTVIALARAGALDHAWHQFSAAGFDRRDDDPAALTVKGRLLKDRALRAADAERREFYLQSADASGVRLLRPAPTPDQRSDPLLLSGDRQRAEEIAGKYWSGSNANGRAETPYWGQRQRRKPCCCSADGRGAGGAGGGDGGGAACLEDHASTLRQFIAIHDALGPIGLARRPASAALDPLRGGQVDGVDPRSRFPRAG